MTTPNSAGKSHQETLEMLPPLKKDPSFGAMVVTQFLGAFNDNLFKQLVLLICVTYATASGKEGDFYQPVAMFLFAIPFVLFSGFAGHLADKNGKRKIVILAKVAEGGIMFAGMLVFFIWSTYSGGMLAMLFVVLFCMGAQSTFFGPAKYGILPEMFRGRDLPTVNGVIHMTTFLAIIFGTVVAGNATDQFEGSLWKVSALCIVISVIGIGSSLLVRTTPVANPELELNRDSFGFTPGAWTHITRDPQLLRIMLIGALFWFMGGVIQPTVNNYGVNQLQVGNTRTSVLAAGMGIGIAIGCVIAGKLCHGQVRFGLVRLGAWGITGSLTVAGLANHIGLGEGAVYSLVMSSLVSLGVFAGFYSVPLTVFIQARPGESEKGRVIASMNIMNWTGILMSAVFYLILDQIRRVPDPSLPVSSTFFVLAMIMLPVAVRFHPPNEEL